MGNKLDKRFDNIEKLFTDGENGERGRDGILNKLDRIQSSVDKKLDDCKKLNRCILIIATIWAVVWSIVIFL